MEVIAPNDLVLESVEVRRLETATSGDGKTHHYDDLLVVHFRSKADLQTLARKRGLHLHVTTTPCVSEKIDKTRTLFDAYKGSPSDARGEVDVWSYDEASRTYRTQPSGPRDTAGFIKYEFHTHLSLTGAILAERYHYDLAKNPMRLCTVLEASTDIAGELFFPAFTSNVIIIPQKSVADAISRAHLE